jgi:SnoaL-like domain
MHSSTSPASSSSTLARAAASRRWLALALVALGACQAAEADPETTSELTAETAHGWRGERGLAARVQRLTDRLDLRAVTDCYGAGHDLIFRDLGGAHAEALAALRRCNREDLITNVFLFDDRRAVQRLTSLREFVGFVDGFALQNGYSSARNVPGDVRIEFTGEHSAKIWSSTAAPHFLTRGGPGPADRPSLDIVSARYVDTVLRERDGVWRTVERDLIVDQIWRGEGGYPISGQ